MGLHSKVCNVKYSSKLIGFSRLKILLQLLQLTVTTVSSLIDGCADAASICQLHVAVSEDIIPPLDRDCNIML